MTMDRRPTAHVFRERLADVIESSDGSAAAFARTVGLDRSTLAQLLHAQDPRLPRAETLAAIAAAAKVSVDWLLGLSHERHLGADIFSELLQVEPSDPSPIDDRMFRWMTEAAGFRIRTVPTTFPDLLKTEAVIQWQYGPSQVTEPGRVAEDAQSRLAYLQRPETEVEVCASIQAFSAFARGETQWAGLSVEARREQLDRMIGLCADLYPSLRLFLYDLRRTYSISFTVLGPKRAAIYVGQLYFVFTSTQHIRVLARRFDELIRAAVVQPSDVPAYLAELRASL